MSFTRQTILDAIPHRPPFLFVDEIREWTEEKIVTAYRFKETEFFFEGHYPDRKIVPGVILCESAMQAGAIFLSDLFRKESEKEIAELLAKSEGEGALEPGTVPTLPKKVPVVGKMESIRFKKIISPGEEIQCEVIFKEKMARVYFMTAKITSGGKLAASFEFACTQTSAE